MVKLRDIAIKTGFNISTVSRALKGYSDISEETCRLVKKAAKELGYRFRQGEGVSGRTIALILPEVSSHYYAELAHSLLEEIHKHSFEMYISLSGFTARGMDEAFLSAAQQDICGILGVIDIETTGLKDNFYEQLAKMKIPVVLLSETDSMVPVDTIYVDSGRCMQLAVDHLTGLGHKQIGYVGDNLSDIRYHALCSALEKKGLVLRREFVKRGTERFELGGYLRGKELLEGKELPTAVVASYDQVAIGAMKAFDEAGLKIPQDISVVGVDNIVMDDYLPVKLTSIANPIGRMGQGAVRLLMDNIKNKEEHVVQNVALQSKLVVRGSTGRPAGG